jgi:hypothetical protein
MVTIAPALGCLLLLAVLYTLHVFPYTQWSPYQDPQAEYRRSSRPPGAFGARADSKSDARAVRAPHLFASVVWHMPCACLLAKLARDGLGLGRFSAAIPAPSGTPALPASVGEPRLVPTLPQSFADALIDIIEDCREDGPDHDSVPKILEATTKVGSMQARLTACAGTARCLSAPPAWQPAAPLQRLAGPIMLFLFTCAASASCSSTTGLILTAQNDKT